MRRRETGPRSVRVQRGVEQPEIRRFFPLTRAVAAAAAAAATSATEDTATATAAAVVVQERRCGQGSSVSSEPVRSGGSWRSAVGDTILCA